MRNILFSILLLSALPLASADQVAEKPRLRVDFNKMIDESNHTKKNLERTIQKKVESEVAGTEADRKKVLDFVDVEIGWGNDPGAVVDRRFDSVGEAQIFDVSSLFDLHSVLYGRPAKLSPEI